MSLFELRLMSKLGVILQARTGSSRLPQKMILPFWENKTVLEILLQRLKGAIPEIPIIVATTTLEKDDAIVLLCNKLEICCYRGSENDVLSRFIEAAKLNSINKIIRVCADNLFLDLNDLKKLIYHFENSDNDYMSFITSSGTPSIRTHYGLWGEGVKLSALEKIVELTKEPLYHEHVTNFIYTNPEQFSISFLPINILVESYFNLRLTIDTDIDFKLQQQIYGDLMQSNKSLDINDVLTYLNSHHELFVVMQDTIQNNSK